VNARRSSAPATAASGFAPITYFPQNRITDHRIGMDWYKLDSIIAGNLQPVTEALIDYARREQREAMGVAE
jgi:peptide chain release factor 1